MPFEPGQVFPRLLFVMLGLEDGRSVGGMSLVTAPLSVQEMLRADPGPLVGLPGF